MGLFMVMQCGYMNVINIIFNVLFILFNMFKFDKKNMKFFFLVNNFNEYFGLFLVI